MTMLDRISEDPILLFATLAFVTMFIICIKNNGRKPHK